MLSRILADRQQSLNCLYEDIEHVVNEMKSEALAKDEQPIRERFEEFCRYVQNYIKEYQKETDQFLNKHGNQFTYADYKKAFGKKDEDLHILLNEYIDFKSRLV